MKAVAASSSSHVMLRFSIFPRGFQGQTYLISLVMVRILFCYTTDKVNIKVAIFIKKISFTINNILF